MYMMCDVVDKKIDDIAFELFAMHCGLGRGIRQKRMAQEKLLS